MSDDVGLDPDWEAVRPQTDEVAHAAVETHLARFFGEERLPVFHEVVSTLVELDVHVFEPDSKRNWFTLVTSGMSGRPMNVPDTRFARHAELLLSLPPEWDGEVSWPVGLLFQLARLPHQNETFLTAGHTIANEDPPQPFDESTALCGSFITRARLTPFGFERVSLADGRSVHFHAVIPIYATETELAINRGSDDLTQRLDNAGVTELLQPSRPSVADGGRRRFRR